MCKLTVNDATMATKIADLVILKKMLEDLTAEVEAASDAVKAYMTDHDADELVSGTTVITWHEVTSKRLDTTGLKKLLGDALDPYYRVSTARRFIIK